MAAKQSMKDTLRVWLIKYVCTAGYSRGRLINATLRDDGQQFPSTWQATLLHWKFGRFVLVLPLTETTCYAMQNFMLQVVKVSNTKLTSFCTLCNAWMHTFSTCNIKLCCQIMRDQLLPKLWIKKILLSDVLQLRWMSYINIITILYNNNNNNNNSNNNIINIIILVEWAAVNKKINTIYKKGQISAIFKKLTTLSLSPCERHSLRCKLAETYQGTMNVKSSLRENRHKYSFWWQRSKFFIWSARADRNQLKSVWSILIGL